jgi:hypothetical protein
MLNLFVTIKYRICVKDIDKLVTSTETKTDINVQVKQKQKQTKT